MSLFIKSFKNFSYLPNLINLPLILLAFIYLSLRFSLLPSKVPLWYTLTWGESQLASPGFLWLIPSGMFVVFSINYFLGVFLFKSNSFLTALISWHSLLVSILGLIALWRIVVLAIP